MKAKIFSAVIALMLLNLTAFGGNPFKVGSTGTTYSTLEDAVGAAVDGDTIFVLENATSDISTATKISKSLTLKSENTVKPVLTDYTIVLQGTGTETSPGGNFTFDNLSFAGGSMICIHGGKTTYLGNISIKNCDVNVGRYTPKDMKVDGIAYPSYVYGAFIACPYNSDVVSTELLTIEGCNIVVDNTKNSGKSRCIFSSFKPKKVVIHDNVFGAPTEKGYVTESAIVFDRNVLNGSLDFKIYRNKFYCKSNDTHTLANSFYLHYMKSTSLSLSFEFNDNEIFSSIADKKITIENGTTPKRIGYASNQVIPGTSSVKIYRNYVNGYCDNVLAKESATVLTLDLQEGHTYSNDRIVTIPSGAKKATDTYLGGLADNFDGTTHDKHNLVTEGKYCSYCDKLYAYIALKRTGLAAKESAVYNVYDSSGNLVFTVPVAADEEQVTLRFVDAGNYTVTEDGWTWGQTPGTPTVDKHEVSKSVGTATVAVTNGETITITFSGSAKTSTPKKDEDSKKNTLNIP